jgi:hypothetical protein
MLADIRRKRPGVQLGGVASETRLGRLLDKLNVAPRLGSHGAGVVVRKSAPVESIFADVIPFLASHFTSFATDAQR